MGVSEEGRASAAAVVVPCAAKIRTPESMYVSVAAKTIACPHLVDFSTQILGGLQGNTRFLDPTPHDVKRSFVSAVTRTGAV